MKKKKSTIPITVQLNDDETTWLESLRLKFISSSVEEFLEFDLMFKISGNQVIDSGGVSMEVIHKCLQEVMEVEVNFSFEDGGIGLLPNKIQESELKVALLLIAKSIQIGSLLPTTISDIFWKVYEF